MVFNFSPTWSSRNALASAIICPACLWAHDTVPSVAPQLHGVQPNVLAMPGKSQSV
jgi:hypothetical protein